MIWRVAPFVFLVVVVALGSVPADAAPSAHEIVLPQGSTTLPPAPKAPPPATDASLGALFKTSSPAWCSVVACDTKTAGALVIKVLPGSPAWNRIQEGDIVVAIDGEPVLDSDRATLLLRSQKAIKHRVSLVATDGSSRAITLMLAPSNASAHDFLTRALLDSNETLAQYLLAREIPDPEEGVRLAALVSRVRPDFAEAYAVEAARRADALAGHRTIGVEEMGLIMHALSEAIRLDPNSADIRATAARVNLQLGQADAAVALATEAIARDNGSSAAHSALGIAQFTRGRAHAAVPELHRAVELDPYEDSYYQDLARAYDVVGDALDARATRHALDTLQRESRYGIDPNHGQAGRIALETVMAVLVASLLTLLRRARVLAPSAAATSSLGAIGATVPSRRTLALLEGLAAAGVWSVVIPYVGPALGIAPDSTWRLEVADHVVPGLLVVVVACLGVAFSLRARLQESAVIWLSTVTVLCGLWIIFTHVSFIFHALQHEEPWPSAAFHSSAGPLAIALAICLWLSVESVPRDVPEDPSLSPLV